MIGRVVLTGGLIVVIAALVSSTASAAVTIDNFEAGDFSLTATPANTAPGGHQIGLSPSDVITTRRVTRVYLSGPNPKSGEATFSLSTTDGPDAANFEVVANSSLGWANFEYYANDRPGVPLDLFQNGANDRIRVTLSAAPAVGDLTLYAEGIGDSGQNSVSLSITGAGIYDFLFSNYPGLDFSSVGTLEFDLKVPTHTSSLTYQIADISAVPEPTTVSLMATATAPLILRRRGEKKRA